VQRRVTAGQDFGSADALSVFTNANCVFTSKAGTSASVHTICVAGSCTANIFANPQQVFANVRPLILGLDGNTGGFGSIRGLPYWNVNLGVKKNIRVTERLTTEASVNFVNFLNHNQLLDPILSISGLNGMAANTISPSQFGQLTTEGTFPRTAEFGIRVSF